MVMGPTCGLILAYLGADVVKVEPAPGGDNTRRLPGSRSGYFGTYNRNKRSISRKFCPHTRVRKAKAPPSSTSLRT